jgi:hypothetical protein
MLKVAYNYAIKIKVVTYHSYALKVRKGFIMNTYFETISDNRYIASEQLTADDMSASMWKNYRNVCDTIAIAAWDTMNGKNTDDNALGNALTALFRFFDVRDTIKATDAYQRRIMVSCITIKTMRSDAMKAARKARTDAKKAWEEDEENETLKAAFNAADAEVERLKGIKGNEWKDPKPMLTANGKHATTECRKRIEDAIVDFVTERKFMTAEEIAKEALALKMTRKANKKVKATTNA